MPVIQFRTILGASAALLVLSATTSAQKASPSLATAAFHTTAASESVRRMSIDDAVRLALEQNLGIRIQRIDPQIQDTNVALARSFWAPSVSSNLSRNSQSQRS